MIQEIKKTDGLSLEECKSRAQDIFNLFKTIIKEFKLKYPKLELSVSDINVEPYVKVYFIGNKRVGTKYDMECWKEVPIYRCNINKFEHIQVNNFFLNMDINYADGRQSSEDWRLDEIQLKMKFKSVLLNCIRDFTETNENLL